MADYAKPTARLRSALLRRVLVELERPFMAVEALNINPYTARTWLHRAGFTADAWREAAQNRVREMSAQGASVPEMATAVGVAASTITRWRRELGLSSERRPVVPHPIKGIVLARLARGERHREVIRAAVEYGGVPLKTARSWAYRARMGRDVWRNAQMARMAMLESKGFSTHDIAIELEVGTMTVWRWRQRRAAQQAAA